jgi:hypothetical protein
MKTLNGILGIVVVIALATPAYAGHVCPPGGCAPWWGSSQQSSNGACSVNSQAATEAASGGRFSQVVEGFRRLIASISSRIQNLLGINPSPGGNDPVNPPITLQHQCKKMHWDEGLKAWVCDEWDNPIVDPDNPPWRSLSR